MSASRRTTEEAKSEKNNSEQQSRKKAKEKSSPDHRAWAVLKRPHITEKATELMEQNAYVFRVHSSANKSEIKKAVEGAFGVDVKKVNVVNVPPKRRRLGRQEGWQSGYKKAIVTIQEGQKIEILPL